MNLGYEIIEEGDSIIVDLTIPQGSNLELPFLYDDFSRIERYSGGIRVRLPNTVGVNEQLKQGVIVDGEVYELVRLTEPVEKIIEEPTYPIETEPPPSPVPKRIGKIETPPTDYQIFKPLFKPPKKSIEFKASSEKRLERLEKFLQNKKYEFQSSGFGHLKRTALGAEIFFNKFNERDKYAVRLIGFLHQVNPKFFDKKDQNIGFSQEDINLVTRSIKDMKSINEGKVNCNEVGSDECIAVFLSDQILEGSGAYGVKRTCFNLGEVTSFEGNLPETQEQFTKNLIEELEKNSLQRQQFPWFTTRLITYQERWRKGFVEALQAGEKWASIIGLDIFESGLKREDFEKTIIKSCSSDTEALPFDTECRKYVKGEKYHNLSDLLSGFF